MEREFLKFKSHNQLFYCYEFLIASTDLMDLSVYFHTFSTLNIVLLILKCLWNASPQPDMVAHAAYVHIDNAMLYCYISFYQTFLASSLIKFQTRSVQITLVLMEVFCRLIYGF